MQGDPPFTFAPFGGILNYSDLNTIVSCRAGPVRRRTFARFPG